MLLFPHACIVSHGERVLPELGDNQLPPSYIHFPAQQTCHANLRSFLFIFILCTHLRGRVKSRNVLLIVVHSLKALSRVETEADFGPPAGAGAPADRGQG